MGKIDDGITLKVEVGAEVNSGGEYYGTARGVCINDLPRTRSL